MAHFDLYEQEQISYLKNFWELAGKYIFALLVVCFGVYLVAEIWNWYGSSQVSKAAEIYTQVGEAVKAGNANKVLNLTYQLENQYPNIEYSAMSSLQAAKLTWNNKDQATTTKLLSWVASNAKDEGLISTARLRLADVLIDQHKFDEAMQQMLLPHDAAFDPLYYIKRGDLYVVKGDIGKARDAYKQAMQKVVQDSNLSQAIQMRLDVLGNN